MVITSMLMLASCIHLSISCTSGLLLPRTQTQFEKSPSDCVALAVSSWIVSIWKALDGEIMLIALIDDARQPKKLKQETVLV
jgi:hypothetical protein